MMVSLRPLLKNNNGAAGAEMALMVPLLVTLMFGSFELGHFFYTEHKLVKSVRDAARFAARQPEFYAAPCVQGIVDGTGATAIRVDKVARFGKVTVVQADKTIISGWDTAVTIELACPETDTFSGIYEGLPNMPIVTVSASVDYPFLFEALGFDATDIDVKAGSQAAVMGI